MTTTKPDWLFGAGAGIGEKALSYVVSLLGTAALVAIAWDAEWKWWQWVIAVAVTLDFAGGVVANGLDSNKRFYHSPLPFQAGAIKRFLHHPVGFTAAHVHPIPLSLLFDGGTWWWGGFWYAVAVAGALAVHRAPCRLQLPVALAVTVAGAMLAPLTPAPTGLAWFPVLALLKLVLAHGVAPRTGKPATVASQQ